jgi:hypothetical protein
LFNLGLNLWHKLNGRGSGTNHRDTFAREIAVVVPVRRMKQDALEFVETRQWRQRRFGERALPRDQQISGQWSLRGDDLLALFVFLPACLLHGAIEADVFKDSKALRTGAQIVLDLWLRRVWD